MLLFNGDISFHINCDAAGLTRSSFDVQEVEDYFNYMGMLAAEGTYDRLEKMLECTYECTIGCFVFICLFLLYIVIVWCYVLCNLYGTDTTVSADNKYLTKG